MGMVLTKRRRGQLGPATGKTVFHRLLSWASRRRRALRRADIIAGYVWLLGRAPAAEELRSCLDHFRGRHTSALHAFQHGLIVSEEFRLRRIHVHQALRGQAIDLFRNKIVFLHLEKCGGTTLRTMLAAHVAPHRVCPELFNGLADWTPNELAAYDLFAGHFDLSVCLVVPGPLAIVTMLREPKARLLSLYNFWNAHRPHPNLHEGTLVGLAQRHSAAAFFAHEAVVQHPSIRDAIVGQLTRRISSPIVSNGFQKLQDHDPILADPAPTLEHAWRALTGLAGFGLVEAYEPSRLLLNRQLGLHMQPIAPQQVLRSLVAPELRDNRPAPATLTPQLERLLDALTPLDQTLYARAAALFWKRACSLV